VNNYVSLLIESQPIKKMKEASLVKFYFAKYFFLAFGSLQWLISLVYILKNGDTAKGQWTAFLFFTLGLILISVQIVFATQIKRVAVGKKKIAVITHGRVQRYDKDEIKSLRFISAFNVYRMKIRGRKGKIYFLPCEESEVIYGLFPSVAEIKKDK
jgi:hypothetical protein